MEQKPAAASAASAALPIPVLALTMSAFAVGTAEFVIAGLLPDIAHDLAVSIPSAGLLVTAYALGVVVGAPILAVATYSLPRKQVLLMMLGIFIIGNLMSATSPNYAVLMVARIVAAFAHGTLFGVGSVVAAELVPANRRASAIALMFTGLTLANIIGVPLGTLVGQSFGWRATFWAITVLGVLSLSGLAAFVPSLATIGSGGLAHEFAVLRRPRVQLALVTTVLGWGGVFALFTYVVPILEEVTGFSPRAATVILFVIGVGLTIGINLGGRLSDRGLMRALIGMLITFAVLSAAFSLASNNKIAAVVVIFLWGIAAFATLPPLQTRVLDSAKEAPNLASTLNVGAFNLGNAGGAFVGGQTIALGFGLTAVPLTAAAVALSGLVVAAFAAALDRQRPA